MSNDLFEKVEITHKVPPILMVDTSGSVRGEYTKDMTIFDKMLEIVTNINAEKFRVLFWNSGTDDTGNFPQGVFKMPFVIDKKVIKQPFLLVKSKITDHCLTFPHLGFRAIEKNWIDDKDATHVYFLTDGKIGWSNCNTQILSNLKKDLKEEIELLFKNHNNIHLHIITIESKNVDLNNIESMGTIAGGDIFEVIQNNNLTKYITEFVSYTLNNQNGYKHISNIIAPQGFIPFGQQYFSETKTPMFIKYLYELIGQIKNDEEELLKVIQQLSSTIKTLTKDKPAHVRRSITGTFCQLFSNTILDPSIVQFILVDTVRLEEQGKAIVFSEYRARLKNLYKQAQDLLLQDTRNAIGLNQTFITLPINDKIVTGDASMVGESININKQQYINSSVKINDLTIPVLPLYLENTSVMNQQCIRQYVRAIISKQYQVGAMDDIVIYIVLGLLVRVVVSDVSEEVKQFFKDLGLIMLKKKRLNSDITELEKLQTGDLPIPNNGKIEMFYEFMDKIMKILGVKYHPMTMWYGICLALGDKTLLVKQLIHCSDSLKKDFGVDDKYILTEMKITPFSLHEIPQESILEYQCIVTMEDTSLTGGYKFTPHSSLTNKKCSPNYVISREGYHNIINHNRVFCPICFKGLTLNDFEKVDKNPNTAINIFINVSSPFENNINIIQKTPITKSNKKGNLIVMKGTIGAGKSTISREIQKAAEKQAYYVVNEGTDKYCKTGMSMKDAVINVSKAFGTVETCGNEKVVVIVDTCNDRETGNTYFGYDFTGWNKIYVWPNYNKNNQKGYFSWTLRNVLQRGEVKEDSNYWLNPIGASVDTCVNVSYKKAQNLFGKKIPKVTNNSVMQLVLNDIDLYADEYANWLSQNMEMPKEVEKVLKKLV